jgi:hypothetical protein
MKKFLLILICLLFMSCASVVKDHTLVGVDIEAKVETLPVTADLAISEQKARGEAKGPSSELKNISKEAFAKALSQDPPSVDKPDVLVGVNTFTEKSGDSLKVTFTGYPAYYTNFRTATEKDSLRLNMVNSSASPVSKSESKPTSDSEWYYSLQYQFGERFMGWGIGAGKSWSNGLFLGLQVEESGLLSPWKAEDYENDYVQDVNLFALGGSLNVGGVYGNLPYDIKLVGGLLAGYWYFDMEGDIYDFMGNRIDTFSDSDWTIVWGPFAKVRWHGLEAGFRWVFFSEENAENKFQFLLGYTL